MVLLLKISFLIVSTSFKVLKVNLYTLFLDFKYFKIKQNYQQLTKSNVTL